MVQEVMQFGHSDILFFRVVGADCSCVVFISFMTGG